MEKQVDFDRKVVGQVNVDSEDTSLWKSVLQKAVGLEPKWEWTRRDLNPLKFLCLLAKNLH